MSTTLIDQAMTTMLQRLQQVTGLSGVYEDREAPFTADEAPCIELVLDEAWGETLGDDHPVRSTLKVLSRVELRIYTRSSILSDGSEQSPRAMGTAIWQQAHQLLMLDPSLGGTATRLRWQNSRWQKGGGDGTASVAVHTYELTQSMRELTLS